MSSTFPRAAFVTVWVKQNKKKQEVSLVSFFSQKEMTPEEQQDLEAMAL